MAAKTEKPIQLNKLKHVGDFTDGQLQAARLTIRMHLDHADYQNTITQSEIKTYATLLDRHPTVICEIIAEEDGEIITMEQRSSIVRVSDNRELVGA